MHAALAHLHLPHISEGWKLAAEWLLWLLAAAWLVRTRELLYRLREVPDLADPEWDLGPAAHPELTVIVPAKDEEAKLPLAMGTLLAQEYANLRIVAVDDRSTDRTGEILEEFAADHPGKLEAIHITELPEGWLGKTFALETATQQCASKYLLFTDADVLLAPSILRRALTFAELTAADHVVVVPTPEVKGWGEATLLALLQLVGLWVVRPWRVADPRSRWQSAGIGAFNLVRRESWEELGGFVPQRLAVLEDITLGRRIKAAGLRQRIAFAPGRVVVHWAKGMRGIVSGLGKNLFATVNFRAWIFLPFAATLVLLFLVPLAGLAWSHTLIPSLLIVACIAAQYQTLGEVSGIPAMYGWLYPLSVLALLWAMLRSVVLVWWRRGVLWRGTLYPLDELRQHNKPLVWEFEAAAERREQRKAERIARPSRLLRIKQRLQEVRRRRAPAAPSHSDARRTRRE